MADLEHRHEESVADRREHPWGRVLAFASRPTSVFELAAAMGAAGSLVGWVAGWLSNGELVGALLGAFGVWQTARFVRRVL